MASKCIQSDPDHVLTSQRSVFLSLLDDIAWDWVNEKLYWTDECYNRIEVYDPKTANRKVLIETGSNSNPRGIVVDPVDR